MHTFVYLVAIAHSVSSNRPHGFDVAFCNADSSYACGVQVGEQMKDSIQRR